MSATLRVPSRIARRALGVGGVLVVGTLAIGLLHTPLGRPLLGHLAWLAGCPAARVTAADVDRLRQTGLASVRGTGRAPARPALGFALDRTISADVEAWAVRAGVSCTARTRGLVSLHCTDVPRGALPDAADGPPEHAGPGTIEDLSFTFGPSGQLVSVDAFSRGVPVQAAAEVLSSTTSRLGALLGGSSSAEPEGGVTLAQVERTPMLTARRRFRFADYVAIVSVSHLASGIAVREQYLSGG
jgi:hypothetical protein